MCEYITMKDDHFVQENQSAEEALRWLQKKLAEDPEGSEYKVVREIERDVEAGYINTQDVSLKELVKQTESRKS